MTVSLPEEQPQRGYDFDTAMRRRLDTIKSYANETQAGFFDKIASKIPQIAQSAQDGFNYVLPGGTNELRSRAVNAASKLKGTPYVWGGESFQEGGFDCSGLVQYVYGQMGIKAPRVASAQASTLGKVTAIQNLKPGDLVAWGSSPATASHIAIYAGNGMVWQAPQKGDVVKMSRITGNNAFGISVSMLG